jgi:hypothetical protein
MWLGACALLAGLAAPAVAATAPPPMPRPRPDHNSQPQPPATPAGQETDQQKLIRTGLPNGEDSDALMPPNGGGSGTTAPIGTAPQQVTLTASITEKGAKIGEGLVWRIFDTKPDKDGKLAMVVKSEKAAPAVTLPPGDYVVHVAYGRAQTSDTLSVANKPVAMPMILDAGGLKLNAAVVGDIIIPFNLLHFDIFTAGATDADRALVAQKVGAGDILTLNAGTYHVVSYFGDANATVRADLRVEPGQLTDATLYQKAAQVSLKLVSDAGGEAIADVDWTVKGSDGQTVLTNTGTFPSTVLEEGDYTVTAKRGDKVYTHPFKVVAGKPIDVEVVTSIAAPS